jgi:hypothetical protein
MNTTFKHVLDGALGAMSVAAIWDQAPKIASLFAIIWYLIRVYEWLRSKFK